MPEVQKVAEGVVVAATRMTKLKSEARYWTPVTVILFATLISSESTAKVLPEDRGDVLYHQYDGGGVTIDGPSVLVRKAYKDKLSFWGNYYADMISGASIDVQATASPYAETRTEFSAGVDYLRDKTLLGIGFTQSEEDDYEASTVRLSVSQDFFGDLSTLSFGYGFGDDVVKRNGDDVFVDTATHHSYQIEWSQIVTATIVANLGYESVVDEGFLNNPYRSVRYLDPTSGNGFSYQAELYPRTRTSDALALRVMSYLPWRAALRGEVRQYDDSWELAHRISRCRTPIHSENAGNLTCALATTIKTQQTSIPTCSPFATPRTFWPATKS